MAPGRLCFCFLALSITITAAMSHESEKAPIEQGQPEAFCVKDWLYPRNYRAAVHIGRNVLLKEVRSKLTDLQPFFNTADEACFFKTYAGDAEHRILLTKHERYAQKNSTTVVVNTKRRTENSEPYPIDGQAIDMTDLSIPVSSKWLNHSYETLYRDQHQHRWDAPMYATLIEIKQDSLRLVGNLNRGVLTPTPARNLDDVEGDMSILWTVNNALSLCTKGSFEPDITTFTD
jgi:hypothetical protein